jgi:hypothetical protein
MISRIPGPHAQVWMNATCAILTKMTRRYPRHDLLGGAVKDPESMSDTRTNLTNSWDVSDAEKLRSTLAWLRDEGHRAERAPGVRDGLGPAGLLAFDYVRLIAVAGWGYQADYISDAEAWSYIAPAATKLQQTYSSWKDLGQSYVMGTFAWNADAGPGCEYNYAALTRDADSPWRVLPWQMDLSLSAEIPAPTVNPQRTLAIYAVASAAMMTLVGGLWLSVGRTVFHEVKGAVADVASTPRSGAPAATTPASAIAVAPAAWDGKTPLVCGGNQQLVIEGVSAELGAQTPITATANCHLTLKNVSLKGATALVATGSAVVEVESGSIAGSTSAVSAMGSAAVNLHGTRVSGPLHHLGSARITGS